ncbi:hypothetical protein PIB30_074495 [Stylosanthes scabra]|uniref:Uncharacterized protein n=1 Tax=Stylosanthes scabra TaxID=79078 RepID=A0ABU6US06_9FABA|nr:hypothetical protein [Stylosanthes scabra]
MGALQGALIDQGMGRFHTGVVVVCDPFFVGLEPMPTQRDPSLDVRIIIWCGFFVWEDCEEDVMAGNNGHQNVSDLRNKKWD